MHQKLFFSGSKCKISPARVEGTPPYQTLPPLGRFAPSQCSLDVRSLRFLKPPPKKNSGYGPEKCDCVQTQNK